MTQKEMKSRIAHAKQQAEQKNRKQIADLKQRVAELTAEKNTLSAQNRALQEQIHDMEYQLMIDKDWLERMQYYINLSDDDMLEIRLQIEAGRKRKEAGETLAELADLFSGLRLY